MENSTDPVDKWQRLYPHDHQSARPAHAKIKPRLTLCRHHGLRGRIAREMKNKHPERLLTEEIAQASIRDSELQGLRNYTGISDGAAKVLAKHKGHLDLGGLTSISEGAAKALATHKNCLDLDGFLSLSDDAAKALAKHKGDLGLRGLRTLSDGAAKALAGHKDQLYLTGLRNLSASAAKALVRHKGRYLALGDMRGLSAKAAMAFVKHDGDGWSYDLDTLSQETAEALAKLRGRLTIDSTSKLSIQALKALAKHKGDLDLNGMCTLSVQAAKALTKHEGALSLFHLASLSDEAARALAEHKGSLYLDGFCGLSVGVAKALARHKGDLVLGSVTTLSVGAAKALAKHEGDLGLCGLTNLSAEAAEALASVKGTPIDLPPPVQKTARKMTRAKGPRQTPEQQAEFQSLRRRLSKVLTLRPLEKTDRFLTRIRKNRSELETYLATAANILDEDHAQLVIDYFKNPPREDWSIRVRVDYAPAGDDDGSMMAFFRFGATEVFTCDENEEVIFGAHAGEGQGWLEDSLQASSKGPVLKRYFLDSFGGAEVGVCGNEVGILTAAPVAGDKWANYVVVADEICDFLNRCLFPRGIVMFVGWDLGGTFVFVEADNVDAFAANLRGGTSSHLR